LWLAWECRSPVAAAAKEDSLSFKNCISRSESRILSQKFQIIVVPSAQAWNHVGIKTSIWRVALEVTADI